MTVPGTCSGQPLPDGWRWVKLEEVASTISKGTTPTTLGHQYTDTGIPFLRAEDVNGWAIEVDKVAFHISNDADEVLSRSRLLPGDFLITIAGTLGRVGYVPPDVPHLNCNQAVAFARIDQSKVDVQYLCFACSLEHVIAPLLDQKAGGALQNLNLQQIRCLCIPLPPLSEQRMITDVLREQMLSVEKAHTAAQARLEAVKALPAAFLRQVFPQPGQTLPDGWRWVRLGETCDRIDYGYTASSDVDVKTPKFLRITDIQNNKVNWDSVPGCAILDADEEANRLEDGDIVFARTGATTGKSYLISNPPRSVFASYLIRVKSHREHVEPNYLFAFFQSDGYWKQIFAGARGGAQPGFNATMLSALKIPLPPLSDQQRIATVLHGQMAAMGKARAAVEEELNTINALPAALLHRAFNGDL